MEDTIQNSYLVYLINTCDPIVSILDKRCAKFCGNYLIVIVMEQSRLRFKSALRYCKVNEDAMRSNAFAKSLIDKDMNSFWRGIRKVNNAKIPLASTVENCVDELSICDKWKTHYESLLNSVQSRAGH